ncbi:MAG: PLDc N-terminal domain-containing protein [Coriobacteriales bacterium]|jgi:hypothetical protein|nr:PLDc N-terminal domain-containing protein [Coriobacteriales bacterium]
MKLEFGNVVGVSDNVLDLIFAMLPFLIPIVLIQLVLMIVALVSVLRHDSFKMGNKVVWVLVVVLINIIGPILYFVLGRGDD